MRRLAALLLLGTGGLLLAPRAPGVPDVPGDPTPPVVTPIITGTLGNVGWYTSNVTVNWSVTDPESIILSTTGCNATTLTTNTPGMQLTCQAESDGGTTTVSKTFKIDKTAPAATATPSRGADSNGWYNHDLSVAFSATDATSGVASCSAAQTYGGPDTASATLAGTCSDQAGNAGPASLQIKYDETAPTAAPTSREPDANGWYNHAVTVTYVGSDGTSGIASCSQITYSGPDDPSTVLSGTCRDQAGNQSAASGFALKYDETPPAAAASPSRPADVNGWHNKPLTVSFSGSDTVSGLDFCDAPKAYSGPDVVNTAVTGSCRDRAGNVAPRSFALKYDASPPATAATPARQPNGNGWFNAPITVTFTGSDSVSGIGSCDGAKTYSGPDTSGASFAGTCTDQAGNTSSASFAVKYDATVPGASATPGRQPNANGWYNAALAVSFAGTDGLSGIDSCDAAKTYSGPDAAAATVSGSCRDRAGNSSSASVALKYDATAPQTTAAASRQPNATGWYTAPLDVSFTGGDATSGIDSCDATKTYAGPDNAAAAVSGSCRDRAGNAAAASLPLKYDATAPSATAAPSRQPNANGWFNAPLSVTFAGTDSTSGTESCDAAKAYGGPDAANVTLSGACRDKAGNAAAASYSLKYDAGAPTVTATPSRQPNGNGWLNAPVTVTFAGSDALSGVDTCTGPQSYSGPDAGSSSLSGSCRDRAGNPSGEATFAFKFDTTPPQVTTANAVRPPDRADWYNRPVAFLVQGGDTTSGIESCPTVTYRGPDSAAASVDAACVDKAGNRGSRAFPLRYDGTGPEVSAHPTRGADSNGWYNQPLVVGFAGQDGVSGLESCDGPQSYDGPDGAEIALGGACIDKAGNVGLTSFGLRYDATAPIVTGADPQRLPDANGWYNHPLLVSFRGTDATSQIESCTRVTYAGPDVGTSSVMGSCRDYAGNPSGAIPFALRYDATAPSLSGVRAKAGNANAELTWTASPDTTLVEIRRGRAVVYRGTGGRFTDKRLKNGTLYRYSLTAYDEAGNTSTAVVATRPTGPLVAPPAGAVISVPPRLAWKAVKGATYYNVQVWRNGRIFSAWPRGTSLRLRRTWIYKGRRYSLTKGAYRWYVWPGIGPRSKKKYGLLLGSSSFVVR